MVAKFAKEVIHDNNFRIVQNLHTQKLSEQQFAKKLSRTTICKRDVHDDNLQNLQNKLLLIYKEDKCVHVVYYVLWLKIFIHIIHIIFKIIIIHIIMGRRGICQMFHTSMITKFANFTQQKGARVARFLAKIDNGECFNPLT